MLIKKIFAILGTLKRDMKNTSKTYRLFTLFTAAIVAVSISMPSVLLAAAHCNMDKQQSPIQAMSGEHCTVTDSHSTHANYGSSEDNGEWSFNCACDLRQSLINTETITTITKTTKAFAVSVIEFVEPKLTDTATFFADTKFSSHTAILPLFLLNSVFLN